MNIIFSKMLMGVDIEEVSVIVFVRPMNMLHYVVQGAGRGGRRNPTGKRNRVLVYILYNASDIAENVPGMSVEIREFCKNKDCLKVFLRKYFDNNETYIETDWCCNSCDLKTVFA